MRPDENDDRIARVGKVSLDDTPITMTRNRAARLAVEKNYDYLLMIDSDMCPDMYREKGDFWKISWEFMLSQRDRPSMIAAPYCGPPPNENVYVFRWAKRQSGHPNADLSLDQFNREEAAKFIGIHPVDALPTGLILIDTNCFRQMPKPWFEYEWTDEYRSNKASTEDVFFSRNASLLGMGVYCNWDCWAGHHKRKLVGKPELLYSDDVRKEYAEAILRGSFQEKIRHFHVGEPDEIDVRAHIPAIAERISDGSISEIGRGGENQNGESVPGHPGTDDKDAKWKSLSDSVTIWREYPPPNTKATWIYLRGIAYENGEYRIVAWSAKGDKASDLAIVRVTVGDPPKPPDPDQPDNPDPEPKPGPEPKPDEAFVVKIKQAYNEATETQKKDFAEFYAEILRVAAEKDGAVFNSSIDTTQKLFKIISDARKSRYANDFFMLKFKEAVSEQLSEIKPGPMADRKAIAQILLKVAATIDKAIK
ncbi:MAG: hypothetical protein HC888_00780 [Candidatus Competibacteraceae bacterium]|nr:hypothetical protein [Candidatus Competibacteraceae bacterium]